MALVKHFLKLQPIVAWAAIHAFKIQLVTVYWQVTQGATQGWQLRGWKTTLPWVLGALEEAK